MPRLSSRPVLLALVLGAMPAVLVVSGCDPVKMPHEQPGPIGCGKRDPRDTAPGMLSVAQKKALQENGNPAEVRPNALGGLDWLYRRSSGSVFGEQQTVELFVFDVEGILRGRDTDVVRKVGK
jgi:hypothetical protein